MVTSKQCSKYKKLCVIMAAFVLGLIVLKMRTSTFNYQYIFLGNEDERKTVLFSQEFIPKRFQQNKDPLFDHIKALKELNDQKVPMDDPKLIQIIRDYYIELPSLEPYNLTNPNKLEYSNGQTPFIDSRLNYIENGFYVECGALDGEKGSNSLFFEKVRKWNGVLIEADPSNFAVLKTKHRKSFISHSCLSPTRNPAKMTFNQAYNRGRLVYGSAKQWMRNQNIASREVEVQCFPLYSVLLALNQSTVDFLSLDVEGNELDVLQTIPFDKVNIKMISAEVAHQDKKRSMQRFMESNGYETLLKVQRDDGGVNDVIFRKKDLNKININTYIMVLFLIFYCLRTV